MLLIDKRVLWLESGKTKPTILDQTSDCTEGIDHVFDAPMYNCIRGRMQESKIKLADT